MNARVESRAPAFDIAILKVATPSASQAVIPMGSAHSLKPGQEIIVIGSALGTLQNSVSRGIVSGLRTSGGATLVQTDAATNPGNSGGPMLDRNGAVIGITTMGYKNAEGLNFGVAIDHARDLLEGRQANLGSQRGLTDIQSQSRGSESDRQQQQGEEQLRARSGSWRRRPPTSTPAGSVTATSATSRRSPATTIASGSRCSCRAACRPTPAPAASATTRTWNRDVKQFRALMQRAIDDAARRANVLPGTVRDLLRTNRLEFDWER